MHVRTRAHLSVQSEVLPPAELAELIGAAPSRTTTRGTRREVPPIPATHSWCLDSGLPLDAPLWRHLEALLEHVEPLAGPIGRLCAGEPSAMLRVVREFEPGAQEADLGFWLGARWLDLLRRIGAGVDVDEYDLTPEG